MVVSLVGHGTLHCPLRKKSTLLPRWKDVHVWQHIHQKDLAKCLAKWLSVCLRTKWLWVRVQLQSLNAFHLLVYYNRWSWSTMQSTFTFHLFFQLPQALSHCKCQYKPFINWFEFYLFYYKCWLNYLAATA